MNKTTAIIIGIIILCFGGLIAWSVIGSSSNAVDLSDYNSASVIAPSDSNGQIGDHVRGNADSPVVVVEYADFQCPGCSTTHPQITTLYEEYGDRVAFVFRHFPLSGHQNARAASSAAEAAGLQGYFFEMADALYANQSVWSYATGAERTGIFADLFQQVVPTADLNKFKADMASPQISKKISFDYDLGIKKDKVTGTPSLFVNGEYVDFSKASTSTGLLALMHERIDAALAQHNLPTGPATVENNSNDEE